MTEEQPNNPLHGMTLKAILEELVERHGFEELGRRVRIRCFNEDPSIRSSLKFLRKTQWARTEVEQVWLADQEVVQRNRRRNQRRAAMRAHRAEVEAAGGVVGPLSERERAPDESPPEAKPEAKPAAKKRSKKGDLPSW